MERLIQKIHSASDYERGLFGAERIRFNAHLD